MFHKFIEREFCLTHQGPLAPSRSALARFTPTPACCNGYQDQTECEADEGCRDELDHGFTTHPSNCFQVSQFGMPTTSVAKQGGDDHLHQPRKIVASSLILGAKDLIKAG